MAIKQESVAENMEDREGMSDGPLMDSSVQAVKKMIAKGKERGYITYDEINETLPQEQVSSEQIEDILAQLSEMGIMLSKVKRKKKVKFRQLHRMVLKRMMKKLRPRRLPHLKI